MAVVVSAVAVAAAGCGLVITLRLTVILVRASPQVGSLNRYRRRHVSSHFTAIVTQALQRRELLITLYTQHAKSMTANVVESMLIPKETTRLLPTGNAVQPRHPQCARSNVN